MADDLSFRQFMSATVTAARIFHDQGGNFEHIFKQTTSACKPADCRKSPLAGRPGSKFFLARRIAALLPPHRLYVEPFCGSAAVFFRKEPSQAEVLNDLNGDIINFFAVVRDNIDELLKCGQFALHSREMFKQYVAQSKTATNAARAWQFAYILKCSFASRLENTTPSFAVPSPVSIQPPKSLLSFLHCCQAASQRLDRVTLENQSFEKIIRRYDGPHTLFYCDPPYPHADRYFNIRFTLTEHSLLAKSLRSIRGKFLLSLPDSPLSRELYAGFPCVPVQTRYAVKCSQYEVNTMPSEHELIIANFKPDTRKITETAQPLRRDGSE